MRSVQRKQHRQPCRAVTLQLMFVKAIYLTAQATPAALRPPVPPQLLLDEAAYLTAQAAQTAQPKIRPRKKRIQQIYTSVTADGQHTLRLKQYMQLGACRSIFCG